MAMPERATHRPPVVECLGFGEKPEGLPAASYRGPKPTQWHVGSAGRELYDRIGADLAAEYAELLADLEPGVRSTISEVVRRLGRSFAARVDTSGGSCCVVRT